MFLLFSLRFKIYGRLHTLLKKSACGMTELNSKDKGESIGLNYLDDPDSSVVFVASLSGSQLVGIASCQIVPKRTFHFY